MTKKKNVVVAIILNILLVGAGHIYLGMWLKGVMLFIFAILAGIFTAGTAILLPMGYAVFDAFRCTKKINAGVPPGKCWDY
ncbi:MAG: sugar ABC transporter permease [Deltaproteobacteria bacterium]